MVLPDSAAFTSLKRGGRRDDANTIPIRVVYPGVEGKPRSRLLQLKVPLDFGEIKFAVEDLNSVKCIKRDSDVLVEFRASSASPVDCYVDRAYTKRLQRFLQRHNISLTTVNAAPILPINPSAAPELPKKPQFGGSSHLPSGPIVPAKPNVLPPKTQTENMVESFFQPLSRGPLEGAASPGATSLAATASVGVTKITPKATPTPRPRKPVMLSGDNSGPSIDRAELRKLAPKPSPKPKPKPNSKETSRPHNTLSSSPDRPAKKRNTNTHDDDQGALIQPTPDFIATIEKSHKPIKYKHTDGRTTHITIKDISRLQEKVFLDDSLISFFLKLYHEKMESPESTYVFSTFFYPRIENEDANKKWIQRIDFGTKHLIIIPVHQHAHWSAVVISGVKAYIDDQKKAPTIVYFDSLGATLGGSRDVFKKCVAFMTQAFESIPGLSAPLSRKYTKLIAKVPVQSNLSDCGVFMLEFMRKVMEGPVKYERAMDVAVSNDDMEFSEIYNGTLNSRKDYLEILRKYGEEHPDMSAPSEGELSELEVCDPVQAN